jgi:hypothetical protein
MSSWVSRPSTGSDPKIQSTIDEALRAINLKLFDNAEVKDAL